MRAPYFMLSLLTWNPGKTDSFQSPCEGNKQPKANSRSQVVLHANSAREEQQGRYPPFSSTHNPGAKLASQFETFVNREKLEDRWIKDAIKSPTRFLSYEDCRNWVQAQNMWTSKREWESWISMGEKHNSLVPSNPEAHYKKRGTWVSWEDFLRGQ